MRATRRGRTSIELALALVAFVFVAWLFACIVNSERDRPADDAFISFIYARNLNEGYGLRYNASDAAPTAGTSSLLHVGVCAAALRLGLDPLAASRAIGILALLTLALVFAALGWHVTRAPPAACVLAGLAVVFLWGLLPESAIHFGSGLDTLLYAGVHGCVVAWAAWVASDDRASIGVVRTLIGAVLLVLLVLARPEGLALAVGYVAVLAFVRRPRGSSARGWLAVAPVAAALVVFAIAYGLWRVQYFGELLSNPYYVKVSNAIFGSDGSLLPGGDTTGRFMLTRIAPIAVLVTLLASSIAAPTEAVRRAFWLCMPAVATVLAYSRAIHEMAGGYRYEYPQLVPFAAALVVGLCALRRRAPTHFAGTLVCGAIVLPLLGASSAPAFTNWLVHPRSSSTLWWPNYTPRGNALARLGLDLADTGLGERATILLSGAGQVPYYSRMRAIDWIGLNHSELSGREARTIEQMWSYIDGLRPDLAFSILPPAAFGSTSPEHDPNFQSEHVQRTLQGRGSALFLHWDHARVAESFWREMVWLRDRCEFAACYQLGPAWGDDWWVLVYVRRDSPHRERLLEVLSHSTRTDGEAALPLAFPFDPRRTSRP